MELLQAWPICQWSTLNTQAFYRRTKHYYISSSPFHRRCTISVFCIPTSFMLSLLIKRGRRFFSCQEANLKFSSLVASLPIGSLRHTQILLSAHVRVTECRQWMARERTVLLQLPFFRNFATYTSVGVLIELPHPTKVCDINTKQFGPWCCAVCVVQCFWWLPSAKEQVWLSFLGVLFTLLLQAQMGCLTLTIQSKQTVQT